MNRIILIGNGFDLAHGMKTSYRDFIEDYWDKVIMEIKERKDKRFFEDKYGSITISSIPAGWGPGRDYSELMNYLKRDRVSHKLNNSFLDHISLIQNDQNWVDIEDEYYRLLKETMSHSNKPDGHNNIEKLNKDFKAIQKKLSAYLIRVEEKFKEKMDPELNTIIEAIGTKVYQPFNCSNFTKTALEEEAKKQLELLRKDKELLDREEITLDDLSSRRVNMINKNINEPKLLTEIKNTLISSSAINYFDINIENIMFLNFNYTSTDKLYNNTEIRDKFFMRHNFNSGIIPTIQSINIHGSISEPIVNPIIFGFGDELDEDYKSIENLNENKYLENIKSINYLETGNYKSLLSFIESDYYEIFIFGHSCGISDRTLLNTMFEHDNCASIKVFYHERKDGEDNYSDVVRNISRNFNDKAKMRDRVVNKRRCEPLV